MACITTVLFDLGGVACRFDPERRLRALASAYGLSELEVRARIWDSGFDRDCDRGRYTAHEMFQRVRSSLGLTASYDEFCRMWAVAVKPDPRVLALVDSLGRDGRTGLLTDNGPVLRGDHTCVFPTPPRHPCRRCRVRPTLRS